MAKLLICVVFFTILALVGMWLFWHAVSALYYLGQVLLMLALVVGAFYVAFVMLKAPPKVRVPGTTKYLLADPVKSCIYGFREQPTTKDVVMLGDDMYVAKMELSGEIVQLNKGETIKILEESEDAVKVKVAKTKSKDNVFWVPKDNVIKSSNVYHFSDGEMKQDSKSLSVKQPRRISGS